MKYLYRIITFVFLVLVLTFTSTAQDFDLNIGSAILIDADTGQVLFAKNAEKRLPPASITKIMTLLIAMEQVEKGEISLDDNITISKFAESMGGSQIFLKAGTRIPLRGLLESIAIASANDSSVAVAEAIAGTYGNFVNWMNQKAEKLGLENTHFENTTGLPTDYGEHYSSAHDIAIMARELVKYPKILKWTSIWVDYLPLPDRDAMLVNTNKLINSYPDLDGLKTGHTKEAGFCLAATAKRNNLRLISVVLNADTEKEREEITARLLDYGFNAFEKNLIISKGDRIENIDVPNGKKTVTSAEASEDLYIITKKGSRDNVTTKIIIDEDLRAPINQGQVIGEEVIIQEEEIIDRVNLVAVEKIEKANIFTRIWRSFVNWIGSLIEGIIG